MSCDGPFAAAARARGDDAAPMIRAVAKVPAMQIAFHILDVG
jgi:hypothetical protein